MGKPYPNKNGFTLVEVLVVLLIVSMLGFGLYTKMHSSLYVFMKNLQTLCITAQEKAYVQHGMVSCYLQSGFVAYVSIWLARRFGIRVHLRSLVRGALLHDYFLYDWHIKDPFRKAHGFSHAAVALQNAERDFHLNAVERDMIAKHMFPLNLTPPRYRESVLVCIADKICAVYETFSIPIPKTVLQMGQI